MAWNITLSKHSIGGGVVIIRVTSNETPTPNGSDPECGSTIRTYTVERQREGGSWETIWTGGGSTSSFSYDDEDLYYDGDYRYRLSYLETFYLNEGSESEPFCQSYQTSSSPITSDYTSWSNSYDNPNPIIFTLKKYQNLNTWVNSNIVTLSGIDGSGSYARRAYGSTSNNQFRINGGAWINDDNDYLVYNGDTIQARVYSPSSTGQTRGTGVYIGGVLGWFVVKTYPTLAEYGVQFPTSGEAGFLDLASVFGPQQATLGLVAITLSDYTRGGNYIHDIDVNSGVPTTTPLNFPVDFYGAWGFPELFGVDSITNIASLPDDAEGTSDALSAITGATAEFYWTITVESGPPPTVIQANPGVYDVANRYLTLRMSGTPASEVIGEGLIHLHARIIATGETVEFTGEYYLHVIDTLYT